MAKTKSNAGKLAGKAALITGAGTGIGKAIAEAFVREGASVALTGRRKDVVENVAAGLRTAGSRAVAIAGDVSNRADCVRMVEETVEAFGGLHILVNNAGVFRYANLESTTDADIDSMIDINLKGPIYLMRAALPHLRKHKESGGASVLNISTCAALTAVKDTTVYASAKAGLNHLTRCLAKELGPEQIRVNAICPGVVETPIFETTIPKSQIKKAMEGFAKMHPLGRVGQPPDVAEISVFISAQESSWITGAIIPVDGGIGLG